MGVDGTSVTSSALSWPPGDRQGAVGNVEEPGEGPAAAFRAAALPDSTRAAYAGDWARWQGWCARVGATVLPADPLRVAEYVAEAATLVGESGRAVYAPSTLARWVAGLNAVHRAAGSPAPGDDLGVKATLRGSGAPPAAHRAGRSRPGWTCCARPWRRSRSSTGLAR